MYSIVVQKTVDPRETIFIGRRIIGRRMTDLLNAEIAKGNDEYVVTVDAKPQNSLAGILTMKRNARIEFTTVGFAVNVAAAVAAMERTLGNKWPDSARGKLQQRFPLSRFAGNIGVWLHSPRGTVRVSKAETDLRLRANEFVTLTPLVPLSEPNPIPFLNHLATVKSEKGMFYYCARRVAASQKVSRSSGRLKVIARRIGSNTRLEIDDYANRLARAQGRNKRAENAAATRKKKKGRSRKARMVRPIPENYATSTNWVVLIEPSSRVLKGR